jgi:hypothetical protein
MDLLLIALKYDDIYLYFHFHPVQVKADIEKRIQEKEEEFEGTRRNHAKVRVPLFRKNVSIMYFATFDSIF